MSLCCECPWTGKVFDLVEQLSEAKGRIIELLADNAFAVERWNHWYGVAMEARPDLRCPPLPGVSE